MRTHQRFFPCWSLLGLLALCAAATHCGSDEETLAEASTKGGAGGSSGQGAGGSSSGGSAGGLSGNAGTAGSDAGTGGAGEGGANNGGAGGGVHASVSFPQMIRGAAYADSTVYPSLPLVVEVKDVEPDTVTVSLDGGAPIAAVALGKGKFRADIDAAKAGPGKHQLSAQVTAGGGIVGESQGTLSIDTSSKRFTEYGKVGPGLTGTLHLDTAGDRLGLSWVDVRSGKHQLYLSWLDGAYERIAPDDIVLNAAGDTALSGYTALSRESSTLGAVYRVPGADGGHWFVKLRGVNLDGVEKFPAIDLTAGEAAFSVIAAGADPKGVSGAWLHIRPPDPKTGEVFPVELRFARYNLEKGALEEPLTLDQDQPQPAGATEGPLRLEPLADLGIACNDEVCVVSYTRNVWNSFVQLNIPKLHLAVVALGSNHVSPPVPVAKADWDTQNMGIASGHHLIALHDGTFALVYSANDTAAAVTPKSPCDDASPRNTFFAARLDAKGALIGKPKAMFDHEGQREYPRLAPHPGGFAMFWEDQRSYCGSSGHFRMSPALVGEDLTAPLSPYLELPGSVGTPPSTPDLAVTGTNAAVLWSDNRVTNSVLDPRPEIFLDTFWHE